MAVQLRRTMIHPLLRLLWQEAAFNASSLIWTMDRTQSHAAVNEGINRRSPQSIAGVADQVRYLKSEVRVKPLTRTSPIRSSESKPLVKHACERRWNIHVLMV